MNAPLTVDLKSIPATYRLTAAAFLAGVDVKSILSKATLTRHAKALHPFGIHLTKQNRHATHPDHA